MGPSGEARVVRSEDPQSQRASSTVPHLSRESISTGRGRRREAGAPGKSSGRLMARSARAGGLATTRRSSATRDALAATSVCTRRRTPRRFVSRETQKIAWARGEPAPPATAAPPPLPLSPCISVFATIPDMARGICTSSPPRRIWSRLNGATMASSTSPAELGPSASASDDEGGAPPTPAGCSGRWEPGGGSVPPPRFFPPPHKPLNMAPRSGARRGARGELDPLPPRRRTKGAGGGRPS